MMSYFLYFLFFLLSWILTSYLISHFSRRQQNLPPGPIPFPVIGNLLNLGNKPHKSAARLSKIYGPVMILQLGSVTTIIVSSPSSAKEVLRKKDVFFSHRTVPHVVESFNHCEFSVAWLPPQDQWRNIRKIANSTIFSTGSLDSSSHLRRKNVHELLTKVDACCRAGVAINIGQAAFDTTLNLLTNTFFSVDVADLTRRSTTDFKEIVWQVLFTAGQPNLSDYFPLLKRLDAQGIKGRVDGHLCKLLGVIDGMIDERLEAAGGESGDDSSDGDTLDALLKITRESSGQGFNRVFLRHMLADLFIAGTDTTSSTLEWAMTELINNPHKLKKAQEELNSIIGRDKSLEEEDISKLPYLQVVIKETFRLHPPAPFLLPRKATTDVELSGFMVPKNSQVLINVWAISRDPKVWKDAKEFQPERFIGSDIDIKGQDFEITPFGAGRRICPGMPLATKMLPIMLASLIYSYDWKLEDGITMDMEEKVGLTLLKAQPLMVIPMSKP